MSVTALGIPDVDPALEAQVVAGLHSVEARLQASVEFDDDMLSQASGHLISAGGKRFRPMMVLVAGHVGDPTAAELVSAAAVVELTHVATLYHDDVMDDAAIRRGADSVNARWGNSVAILVGDLLFAQASDLCSELGAASVRLQARTFSRLVRGQYRETVGPAAGVEPVEHYLTVLADKTASLIATSARFGGVHAGAEASVVEALGAYGEHVGMAFQLADDLLDIEGDPSESGKMPGTDLREGVPTLPALYVQQSTDPADAQLRQLLSGPIADDAEHAEALAALRVHPAMGRARAELRRWVDGARTALDGVPAGAARRSLDALCGSVVDRTG